MTDDAPRTLDATATLARALTGRGLEVRQDGALLLLPRDVRARATVIFIDDGVIQLDVMLELWPGTIVLDSCAGFGATEEAQIADAWTCFDAGTLPVLLAAFLYHDVGDEVEQTAWEVDDTVRAITAGDVICRGLPLDTSGWEAAIRAMVEASTLPQGTHWLRAYAAIEGDRVVATEVLLDNQPWEWGQEALATYAWPAIEGRASARVFVAVQGGLDVGRALADLIALAELPDADLEKVMVARGVDAADAALLVALVPLAFGRRLLEVAGVELPLSDEAVVVEGPERTERRFRLEDDPIFAEAAWLAEEGTYSKGQFLAVARRSAEVRAFEQLAEKGDLAELELTAPVIERP